MKKQNIVMDFTANPLNNNQPLAVMPARIAKLALCALAMDMGRTTLGDMKESLIHDIRHAKTSKDLARIAMEFANERMLIDNIMDENWDAYAVEQPKPVEQGQATFSSPRQYSGFSQEQWDQLPEYAQEKFMREYEEIMLVDEPQDEREPAHTMGNDQI